jgi:hypothetical protein
MHRVEGIQKRTSPKQNEAKWKRKRDDSSFRKFKNPRLRIHDSDNDAESDESNL